MQKRSRVRIQGDDETLTRLRELSADLARLTPASSEQALARLSELAFALKANNFEWAAAAVSAYLIGDAVSLDKAFGTLPSAKAGRKRTTAVDNRTKRVRELRLAGWTWPQIADELQVADARQLRREYQQRLAEMAAAELTTRLSLKDRRRSTKRQ
jgi:hypothetical protein